MARLAIAYVIAFVGMVIGIPGRLLSDIARWIVRYAGCVADIPESRSVIGKFERTTRD
jgi:hypothetical protein